MKHGVTEATEEIFYVKYPFPISSTVCLSDPPWQDEFQTGL